MSPEIHAVAARFAVPGQLVAAESFGAGHINRSYVLTFADDRGTTRFLLQRINERVFPNPTKVMENIRRVTAHLADALNAQKVPDVARRTLRLVPTHVGKVWHRDAVGGYWRMYPFIENTRVLDAVQTPAQTEQAGRAFGTFQRLLADLGSPRLDETIADFHNTPMRFEALERASSADRCGRAALARAELDFALARRELAPTLLDLHRSGGVPERIVHNDAKISNVLFDKVTGEALCVVDLDTVMPGLSLYDFGDMVRSMTTTATENEQDLSKVELALPLFEALARGYLAKAGELLTLVERRSLVLAGKLITLEQGVRFLTDYLGGNVYYKFAHPSHSLHRCRTQFKLLASIERSERRLDRIVESL